MIEIDGSLGEGGGQIVRTAISLSAVTGQPVKIGCIRVGRREPGLKAQHVRAIQTVGRLCSGEHAGVSIGSTEVVFKPSRVGGGALRVDIGTAGSISLLLQCVIPLAFQCRDKITLHLAGGTDVAWSPSVDYVTRVFLPAISKMGFKGVVKLVSRGYYPKGGGVVTAELLPSSVKPYNFEAAGCGVVQGVSHSSNLPAHIIRRQRIAAEKVLNERGFVCDIGEENLSLASVGSGITLWCGLSGACSIGGRGIRAEHVGRSAGEALLLEVGSGGSVDLHLADQLILYMGLAGGGSFAVRELSSHARTNIFVVEQMLGVEFIIEQKRDGLFLVSL